MNARQKRMSFAPFSCENGAFSLIYLAFSLVYLIFTFLCTEYRFVELMIKLKLRLVKLFEVGHSELKT